jgi:hypothetical protein
MRRTDRLSIHIINRLLDHAENMADGPVAHDIELPPGYHRAALSIAHRPE